jgi:translation initiation factor 6
MPIKRMDFNRIPFIGAFSLCTEKFVLIPDNVYLRPDNTHVLGVPVIRANVSKSPLLGILLAGNSRCILCSELFEVVTPASFADFEIRVEYLPSRLTALGNLVLSNDYGAIVSPDLPASLVERIGAELEVPAERGSIAGYTTVGAVGIATNRGVVLHPGVSKEEVEFVEQILKVPVDVGTACGGVGFLGLCVIANSKGALAGSMTTGPELGRLESSLGFLR